MHELYGSRRTLCHATATTNKLVSSPEIVKAIESVSLAVGDVRKLVQNVDSRVGPLASSVEGTVNDYGNLARNADSKIDTLSLGLGDTIKEIQKAVSSIEKTLGEAGNSSSSQTSLV